MVKMNNGRWKALKQRAEVLICHAAVRLGMLEMIDRRRTEQNFHAIRRAKKKRRSDMSRRISHASHKHGFHAPPPQFLPLQVRRDLSTPVTEVRVPVRDDENSLLAHSNPLTLPIVTDPMPRLSFCNRTANVLICARRCQ